MTRSTTAGRPLRVLVLVATALALALSASPAVAAKKSATQVRKWSATTHTVAPGTSVKYTVRVTSRGKPSKRRVVVLQRYSAGRWVRATQARTSRFGNATVRMKVGARSGVTHRVRIKVKATGKHRGRVTRAKKIAVRTTSSSATARSILALVNEARATSRTCGDTTYRARGALTLDTRLNAAAQGHARDMAQHDYFDHTGRDGSSVGDRVTREGYTWRAVGENIAAGQRTAQDVVRAWLDSAGHCANIMSGAYTHLGVGYATSSSATYPTYWSQNFAAPR